MNRRGFLNLLGKATIGSAIVYSFPSIIVPKNIVTPYEIGVDPALGFIDDLNLITMKEIYPEIRDYFFTETPLFAMLRHKANKKFGIDLLHRL